MNSTFGRIVLAAVVACLPASGARAADLAGFGIGVRLAFASSATPSATTGTSTSNYFRGGQIRMRLTPRVGLEGAVDYRRQLSSDGQSLATTYPIQASLLFSLLPGGKLNPYVLGGVGWYMTRTVNASAPTTIATSTTQAGYHAGFGAEIAAGPHVVLHGDYRYTGVNVGLSPGSTSVTNGVAITHTGHMFTSGITLFF